jgi:hypothetical protein
MDVENKHTLAELFIEPLRLTGRDQFISDAHDHPISV